MKILVTGACGYKGHVLVPKLLSLGHSVLAFDIQWFGNFHIKNENLHIIKGDIRNIDSVPLDGVDCIIHLASIANDPCGDLNPKLTWEVSALATMQLVDKASRLGIKRFIYASSGSVYGVKNEIDVVEDLELDPISEYNKTKMVAERVLLSYAEHMVIQIIRPATVCGYSPRMRLDLSVNLLTMQALKNAKITVLGGYQLRPNIHIDDITDIYLFLIDRPDLKGIFNAGFENMNILSIANLINEYIPTEIEVKPSIDPRSYRVNSDKLLKEGYKPKKSVKHAIEELKDYYKTGILQDEDCFHNLRWMEKTLCF